MSSFVLDVLSSSGRWLLDLIVSRMGWPGLIAAVAAVVLVLSASPKALKLLSSPRGLVVVTTVMLAALTCVWWGWGGLAAPAETAVASASPSDDTPAEKPSPEPEPQTQPAEEVAATPPPAAMPAGGGQALMAMPLPGGFMGVVPTLWVPPAGIVRLPSLVVAGFKKAVAHHRQGGSGHPAASPGSSHAATSQVAAGRAGSATQLAGGSAKPTQKASKPGPANAAAKATSSRTANAGKPAGSSGNLAGHNPPAGTGGIAQRPMSAAQINRLRNRQAEAEMNQFMGGMIQEQSGGMHPTGGMHPMGGGHPGNTAHPGGTHHPAGHPR